MKIGQGILNKKKLNDLLVYGFGQAINLLSPLIVLPYLIAVCGEEGLGKIGVGFSLALILSGIVDYGSYIKGVKEISVKRTDILYIKDRVKAIYLSKLLLLLGVLSIAGIIIITIPFFSRDTILFFLSLTMVIGQFINPAWFFQATENFKWISAINILSKAIYVSCVFIFINTKSDYILANLFFGLGAIIANSIGFIYIMRHYSISFGDFSFAPAFTILRDEFSLSISQFFLSIYQFFPIMIVSYFGGDFMAGQYRVIDQIIMIFKSYLNIFFYFVFANVCYEIDKNLKHGLAVWAQFNGLNFLLVLVLVIVFYINADLIFIFFKLQPEQIGIVTYYFRIALIIPLLIAISQPLRQLMFAFDKNKIYITITIIATVINVMLLYFLTLRNGLPGTFLSIIAIEFIVIFLYVFIINKFFRQA